MDVLIVSGFLGSGKTRFINELIKNTQKTIAIIENECSDFSIDRNKLLQNDKINEKNIFDINGECACCNGKSTLTELVLTISGVINPDILIIEPSGEAKLSNILQQLRKIQYDRIKILSPIAIIDGKSFEKEMQKYGDYIKDVINNSGYVIVTKSEEFTYTAFENIAEELEIDISRVIPRHYSLYDDNIWNNILSSYLDKKYMQAMRVKIPQKIFDTYSIENIRKLSIDEIVFIMELMIRGVFGKVIRAKGYVTISNEKVDFDLCYENYMIAAREEMDRVILDDAKIKNNFETKNDFGVISIIGDDLKIKNIEDMFCE